MNKRQLWKKDKSEARTISGKKRLSSRARVLVLLAALLLPNLARTASAQTCFELCQSALVGCMQAAQGDPLLEARCQDQYDKCSADCM